MFNANLVEQFYFKNIPFDITIILVNVLSILSKNIM